MCEARISVVKDSLFTNPVLKGTSALGSRCTGLPDSNAFLSACVLTSGDQWSFCCCVTWEHVLRGLARNQPTALLSAGQSLQDRLQVEIARCCLGLAVAFCLRHAVLILAGMTLESNQHEHRLLHEAIPANLIPSNSGAFMDDDPPTQTRGAS